MKDYYVLIQVDYTKPAEVGPKVRLCSWIASQKIIYSNSSMQILDLPDIPWASQQLWAPDVTEKHGEYFLYFPAKDKDGVFRIGVAKSHKPDGKFKAEPSYIPGAYSIDPAILADTDGCYYIYFGGLWGGQLQAWNNNTLVSAPIIINRKQNI